MTDKGTSMMEKTKDKLATENFTPNRKKTREDKLTDGPNRPAE